MRRILIIAAFAALACSMAFADGAAVTLQNEEGAAFYYVVDPPELPGLSAGSPLAATRLAEYFAAKSTERSFTALLPGEQVSLTGLANGTHLLVGFFATLDRDAFPVRAISLQADTAMGERFYVVFESPALLDAPRGVGRLAQFAGPPQPAVAAAPATPEAEKPAPEAAAAAPEAAQPSSKAPGADTIASFSASFDPVVYTRESQGSLVVQPIASSRSWNQPGTRITAISGGIGDQKLTLTLSVAEGFSTDVSYFFYVFGSRTAGTADDFTLELRPRALPDRGACLLWRQGAAPRMFGSVSVSGTTATLEVSLPSVPGELLPFVGPGMSFDLTSCRFDQAAGVYEEFYFATIAMADIPVVTR